MTDYHAVYKGPEGESTQWEDIHRRLGNLPTKAPVWKPEAYTPAQEEQRDAGWLEKRDEQELSDLEDEFSDDRFLEMYRRKRLQELHNVTRKPRFGHVEEIRAHEFVQKVTEASRGVQVPQHASGSDHPGQGGEGTNQTAHTSEGTSSYVGHSSHSKEHAGEDPLEGSGADRSAAASSDSDCLWVVVQLYKDGLGRSALMSKCVDELAEQYPHTKFVRIVSTDCIPKYPDANVPTLLVYYNGACKKHLVGIQTFGGQRTTPEQVALVLNQVGPVCVSSGDADGEQEVLVKSLVKRLVAAKMDGQDHRRDGDDHDDESSDFD